MRMLFYKIGSLVVSPISFVFGQILKIQKHRLGVKYYIFWQDEKMQDNGWFEHHHIIYVCE
jgi:hypothetical protein